MAMRYEVPTRFSSPKGGSLRNQFQRVQIYIYIHIHFAMCVCVHTYIIILYNIIYIHTCTYQPGQFVDGVLHYDILSPIEKLPAQVHRPRDLWKARAFQCWWHLPILEGPGSRSEKLAELYAGNGWTWWMEMAYQYLSVWGASIWKQSKLRVSATMDSMQ